MFHFKYLIVLSYCVLSIPEIKGILEELELERALNETEGITPIVSPGSSRSTVTNVGASKNLPKILMKKQKFAVNDDNDLKAPVNLDPMECVDTTFFHIGMSPAPFPAGDNLDEVRASPSCKWNFIGAEACVPQVSCPEFSLPPDCDKYYMSISDGHGGFQKFCGSEGPKEVIASKLLRDVYIHLEGGNDPAVRIQCTVQCTQRGVGNPLHVTVKPKKERKCFCGVRPGTDRIVNGYRGKKSEFPWLVALVEANTRQPFCGGSIINNRFILTAAHCFKGKFMDYRRTQFLAQADILDITPNSGVQKERKGPHLYPPDVLAALDQGNGTIRYNIEEIFIHPLYVSETNDFDIAVVKVKETINIKSKTLTPICMPPIGSYAKTFANEIPIVAGWGLQGTDAWGTAAALQKLNITVFSQKQCRQFYNHRVNKRMMCAGYKEGGRDSCMGDSGGPLALEYLPKLWIQIGTVSWGEGCAVAENPGVYIRMTETSQWINHVSNSNGASWCETPPLLAGKSG